MNDIQLDGQKFVYKIPTGEDYIKKQPIEVADQVKMMVEISQQADPSNVAKILALPMMDFLKYLAAISGINTDINFLENK